MPGNFGVTNGTKKVELLGCRHCGFYAFAGGSHGTGQEITSIHTMHGQGGRLCHEELAVGSLRFGGIEKAGWGP
jgi:hypothetical protein